MALRQYIGENETYTYLFDGVAERGGIASLNKEQPHIDRGIFVVSYNDDLTCKPVGVLYHDVVDCSQTEYFGINNIVRQGCVVHIINRSVVITNQIVGDPKPGDLGIIYQKGQILVWSYPKFPKSMRQYCVGKFLSKKNQDGFAKFYVGVPYV